MVSLLRKKFNLFFIAMGCSIFFVSTAAYTQCIPYRCYDMLFNQCQTIKDVCSDCCGFCDQARTGWTSGRSWYTCGQRWKGDCYSELASGDPVVYWFCGPGYIAGVCGGVYMICP